MATNFQRIGVASNTLAGSLFEKTAARKLDEAGLPIQRSFAVEVGHGLRKKAHRFDFGSEDPAVIVECKSHRWTTGGNAPSAKLTVWNEAMLYFSLAPSYYRKIFFVLRHVRREQSLVAYYLRRYSHLVPSGVEVWEYCSVTDQVTVSVAE